MAWERTRGHEHGADTSTHKGSDAPIGTSRSGLAPSSAGPFYCHRCIHFHTDDDGMGLCDHPDVVLDAKSGECPIKDGRAIVSRHQCCDYFRPRIRHAKVVSIA
jgi:hypothetical protein